ncbi:hypothetical protein [Microvirga lenta]|uniref:hypothetical protein n=1 Tax=Microvirga lenta TaxID=2881337 RepID=UPI001CFF89F6|nr:hypothetical protein [Microvirga lenta]MCB5175534.1 hypothetical protein [Microvirga lenta]
MSGRYVNRSGVPVSDAEALGPDGRLKDGYGVSRSMLAMDSKPASTGESVSIQDAIGNIPREYSARYARVMSDLASGDTFLIRQALADGASVASQLKRSNDPNNIKAADYLEGTCDLARLKIGDSASDPQSAYDAMRANLSDAWRH